MAPHNRRPKTSITAALKKEADQFEFHALVKLLENIQKETIPLGEGSDPIREPLRIQARILQEFPGTEIQEFIPSDDKHVPPLVVSNFLGIAGHQAPLPEPYTTYIMQRTLHSDTALRDFLDIFNHRILSILHRIRKKFWVGVATCLPEETLLGKCLKALIGLSLSQTQGRLPFPERSLTYYAGILWQKPRSAQGLQILLNAFFRVSSHIQQLQGQWVSIPLKQQTRLGKQHHRLGDSAFVGTRYWDQASYFTIILGPLTLDTYISFLKVGPAYYELKGLITFYVGRHQPFRLNLILAKDQKPFTRLGQGMALGWTSWLNENRSHSQKDDAQCLLNTRPLRKIYQRP